MSFIKEFREFALRGNAIDLAVGIIFGAAFGRIVSSLVADIIMPALGLLIGGIDFKNFRWVLREAQGTFSPVVINYGFFIQAIFDFTIVAFAIFFITRLLNKLYHEKKENKAALTTQEKLLVNIRDLLKNSSKNNK